MAWSLSSGEKRAIGMAGTIGRLSLGLGLLYLALTDLGRPEWELEWQAPVLGLVGFPAVPLLSQAVRLRFSNDALRAIGPLETCVNAAIVAPLFVIDTTRDATLLFFGASLLVAAARGYAGCEVLAISNWLLRRDDQVGCVVFSPLDAAEDQITGSRLAER